MFPVRWYRNDNRIWVYICKNDCCVVPPASAAFATHLVHHGSATKAPLAYAWADIYPWVIGACKELLKAT